MPTYDFPDALLDIRTYLRSATLLNPLHGGRVFFKLPAKAPKSPFMRISQSGGGPMAGEVPMENINLTMELWVTDGKLYETLRTLERALLTTLHRIQSPTRLDTGGTTCRNVEVIVAIDSEDPDTGWPRRILQSVWTVTI